MALTDKKRRFVDALLSGATNREAAIAAGYSEKTASQAGSKLAKDADVLAEVGRRLHEKAESSTKVKPGRKVKDDPAAPEASSEVTFATTDDPRVFLTELMNADGADLRMRLEAAKTLMPYVHGKVADQGKKEQKAEAAKQAGKGRYAQGKPPLSVVKG
ncbi:terminase small subunit [Pseudomonas guariconensis]|uniref:terminase small subunit n=1 Tax=Pseudomonas guariconensis TaxID=1288410 RepID=UPI00209B906B|nr:terminase small subunit [Pseudomonas guariconensis]MCO7634118.1 terminase small subunit [Pseudomonas guariconensis]